MAFFIVAFTLAQKRLNDNQKSAAAEFFSQQLHFRFKRPSADPVHGKARIVRNKQ